MLQLTYNIYIHIAKARLSFRAHTDRCDAVNRSIFRIFRSIYMQRNHTQSSNSALFTCWTHIRHTHIYCEGTTQLLRTYTSMWCSKSINFLLSDRFTCVANTYTAKTRHSLCSYTEWQQRLCAHAATHIHHTYIHCEGTTQLLHIYTSAWCSKSINFLLYQIDLHALQSHTLQRHDTVFAHTQNDSNVFAHALQLIYITHTYTAKARLSFCTYTHLCNAVNLSISIFWLMYMRCNIHRTTATSLRTRCNSYTSHTYTAKAWLSFCASTRSWNAVNRLIFRLIESIYMHRNHIHCKDTTQSLLIYTEQQQHLCAHVATNIWHSHSYCKGMTQLLHTYTSVQRDKSIDFSIFWLIYMHCKYRDQNSFSSLSLMIIQRTQKLTSKWSAFIYIDQSSFSLCNLMII